MFNLKSDKKFILYVEDELVQSKIFSRIIESEVASKGYEVIVFNNGSELIDLINSRHKEYKLSQFGVILLDLSMHDVSGMSMLEAISNKKIKSPPTAILSAREDKKTKSQVLELGAKDYFIKGKDVEELERLIKFILNNM